MHLSSSFSCFTQICSRIRYFVYVREYQIPSWRNIKRKIGQWNASIFSPENKFKYIFYVINKFIDKPWTRKSNFILKWTITKKKKK